MPRSGATEEARCRAALSRAYYAVYHQALRVATQAGFRSPSVAMHKELVLYFQNHRDGRWKAAGATLNELRVARQRADYDDSFRPPAAVSPNNVRLTIARARALDLHLAAL